MSKSKATIDFDAKRALDKERKTAPTVKVGGKTFTLAKSLPGSFILVNEHSTDELIPVMQKLFGDQLDEVMGLLGLDEVIELISQLPEIYGMSAPKLQG